MCIQHGVHPLLATFIAMFVGALAGYVTGFLITVCKLPSLLAGIFNNDWFIIREFKNYGTPEFILIKL